MDKKRSDFGLIIKLGLGIGIGIALGLIAKSMALPGQEITGTANGIMQVVGSVKHICGQFIFYCVPLVIIGFIAPSILRLGQNAGKMLFTAVILAYISSIGAAIFAMAIGYTVIPMLNIPTNVEGLVELPKTLFVLNVPAIMPVMTALVTAFVLGIATLWTRSKTMESLLVDFEKIMVTVVTRFIIPLLPFFIAGTFAQLAFEGSLTTQLPVFLKIILIALCGHFIWLALLYFIGGAVSRRNPWEVVRHYGPAYLTAVGTMSSAATLPVSLSCARKSKVLSRDTVDFMIPVGATIHLCGSVLTETLFCMTIAYLLTGAIPGLGTMLLFALLLGVFAIGAPGVPGGTVMASLGIVISVLGFQENAVALLLAIFALQDSFGTACNVTGDGALALIVDGMYNSKAENLQTGE
ncbi:dicarboxylate/amino acid:cation symporter [Desulfovibrio sp. OttesenSCG-928-M14]|nr:dicarboxylate/amino acid:cation symporter [Desulfovibrio sp. OttesenSCG-928-M16]MDL2216527.1 dicarboxylate/amino acid:cation symporter [Desulfovibrio sp. OttesenSCG-928-M14]